MVAFASNSLLCRAALKQTNIDAATFTLVRVLSGAVALWLVTNLAGRWIVARTARPVPENVTISRYWLLSHGNWISGLVLFLYAAAFSFAYIDLSAGTGALLLFGAVQATMILWGFHKGERLNVIQVAGFGIAVTGFVVLVFPGLSAPPLIASILMVAVCGAWSVYLLLGRA